MPDYSDEEIDKASDNISQADELDTNNKHSTDYNVRRILYV